jgi:hypothetical protein
MASLYFNTITNSFRIVDIYKDSYILMETSCGEYVYKTQDAITSLSSDNYVLIGYL